jgi:gamma-glutamyltranspeptidase
MLSTFSTRRGIVTSPHHLASQTGVAILREGGSATEAAVAMAATLAVVYPHMTGLGGDSFWLLGQPNKRPIAIDASGTAGRSVIPELYRQSNLARIPYTS